MIRQEIEILFIFNKLILFYIKYISNKSIQQLMGSMKLAWAVKI